MTFFGLPLHPLIVHATVVFVPLAALAAIIAAASGRFRRWSGALPMILAVVAAILTPLSTSTGEDLEHTIGEPGFDHAELGDMLLWFTLPLALIMVAAWWLGRRSESNGGLPRILGLVGALVGVGAMVMVALIGHSGAQSAWCGKNESFVQCQLPGSGED